MKTLYLHIGQQKTGTSAIQRFCVKNRGVFEGLGFEYPKMPFKYPFILRARNGHFLVGTYKDAAGKHDAALEAQWRAKGFEVLAQAFGRCDNVILSEERLWDYSGKSPDLFWGELVAHAQQHGYEVKVIVYLRRQDQLALSWYNQMVKQGSTGTGDIPWERWIANPPNIQLDFYRVLERISGRIGKQNVNVRVYDRAELERDGGNLYTDFLGCLGLRMEQGFEVPEEDKNSYSLTPNLLAIKCAVNASPHFTRGSGGFRRAAEACSSQPSDAPRTSLFSPEEARAFLARYEEGNDRIAAVYLHREGPLFSTAVAEVQKWSIDNPWMRDDLVGFFQQVNAWQAAQVRKRAKAGEDAPAAGEPIDTTAWLAYLEDLPVAELGVYGYVSRCLGDLFIFRQSCTDQGVAINELDDATIAYLVDMLLTHARELEALEGKKDMLQSSVDAASAELDALKLQQRNSLAGKVRRAIADPSSAVRYMRRKVRGC